MTNLPLSYAILAMERLGFEQAQGKPMSFAKVVHGVAVVCRLKQDGNLVEGTFIASLTDEGKQYQADITAPVMTDTDVNSAVSKSIQYLEQVISNSRDILAADYLAADSKLDRMARIAATALSENR